MENDLDYISCTSKRVIISFFICLAIAILTTILLHTSILSAITPPALFVTICIIVIILFFASWLGCIAMATAFVFGLILEYIFNKKSDKEQSEI